MNIVFANTPGFASGTSIADTGYEDLINGSQSASADAAYKSGSFVLTRMTITSQAYENLALASSRVRTGIGGGAEFDGSGTNWTADVGSRVAGKPFNENLASPSCRVSREGFGSIEVFGTTTLSGYFAAAGMIHT